MLENSLERRVQSNNNRFQRMYVHMGICMYIEKTSIESQLILHSRNYKIWMVVHSTQILLSKIIRKNKQPREPAFQLTDWQISYAKCFLSGGNNKLNRLSNICGCCKYLTQCSADWFGWICYCASEGSCMWAVGQWSSTCPNCKNCTW